MRKLFLFLAAVSLYGQAPVSLSVGPPPAPYVSVFDYTAGLLTYAGRAPQYLQPSNLCAGGGSTCIQRSDSSLTSVAVSTNVATVTCANACGVWIGQLVTISGCTTSALNGTFKVATTPSSTTYTLAITVADATYNNAAMAINTNNPLTTQAVWEIEAYKYDGSNQLIVKLYANSSSAPSLAWANRTTY